ncbi:mitochondrial ribosome and complex I assembly factor AltMIEF1 [Arctopsyche grandis]|uniref:mitochondrial ribosome and complex I assembly factor AltMIEF1 n=1 Tax=Arctopsyche grandis TaxID=121162 RepID=UPI00406D6982
MSSKREVLKLYKQLLRYGQQLHLTDKKYYQQRIVNEFKKNKDLLTKEDIDFNFKKGQQLLNKGLVL